MLLYYHICFLFLKERSQLFSFLSFFLRDSQLFSGGKSPHYNPHLFSESTKRPQSPKQATAQPPTSETTQRVPPRCPRTPAPRFPSAHVDGSLTATVWKGTASPIDCTLPTLFLFASSPPPHCALFCSPFSIFISSSWNPRLAYRRRWRVWVAGTPAGRAPPQPVQGGPPSAVQEGATAVHAADLL